ncbi:hypothetical protein GPALN_013146 [Globodera pallida]|nr:hypothetical protein GPALN_013146 [Globodera pallida]
MEALSNAALGEEFHQMILWGACAEGLDDLATRIIAKEIHLATANDNGTKRCKKRIPAQKGRDPLDAMATIIMSKQQFTKFIRQIKNRMCEM